MTSVSPPEGVTISSEGQRNSSSLTRRRYAPESSSFISSSESSFLSSSPEMRPCACVLTWSAQTQRDDQPTKKIGNPHFLWTSSSMSYGADYAQFFENVRDVAETQHFFVENVTIFNHTNSFQRHSRPASVRQRIHTCH